MATDSLSYNTQNHSYSKCYIPSETLETGRLALNVLCSLAIQTGHRKYINVSFTFTFLCWSLHQEAFFFITENENPPEIIENYFYPLGE